MSVERWVFMGYSKFSVSGTCHWKMKKKMEFVISFCNFVTQTAYYIAVRALLTAKSIDDAESMITKSRQNMATGMRYGLS